MGKSREANEEPRAGRPIGREAKMSHSNASVWLGSGHILGVAVYEWACVFLLPHSPSYLDLGF